MVNINLLCLGKYHAAWWEYRHRLSVGTHLGRPHRALSDRLRQPPAPGQASGGHCGAPLAAATG